MLVLTRKSSETIVIGGGIVIRVLEASPGRVRIGVEAPDDVLVLRGELAERLNLTSEAREPISHRARVLTPA